MSERKLCVCIIALSNPKDKDGQGMSKNSSSKILLKTSDP